jgi:hypothetical protein
MHNRQIGGGVNTPGWRHLPAAELADLIRVQRSAVHRHLSLREWRQLDRMRRRYATLRGTE